MDTARGLVEIATRVHPSQVARVGMRSGMGDAAALCDAIANDIAKGMRPSARRAEHTAVAKRCGDAIFAMRDMVDPAATDPRSIDATPGQSNARALAALDHMAGVWADAARLTRAVAVMLTHDDRESRIEAFIKQAFVEGAWSGARRLNIEEIAELGRGTGGKNG